MTEAARALRRRMTPAESVLWEALRARQLGGLKFRRQHAVGTFALDFYCASAKLVVEVDGSIHDDPEIAAHDRARSEYLRGFGYRMLRVRNEDVLTDLPSVLEQILRTTIASPTVLVNRERTPSPSIGRGAGGEGASDITANVQA